MPLNYYKTVREMHWPNNGNRGSVQRWWDRQKPPFVQPLDFQYYLTEVTAASDSRGLEFYPNPAAYGLNSYDLAVNDSYADLRSQLGDQSSWGENLAEARQSVGTVERRLMQMASFAGALRKGNLAGAAGALGLSPSSIPKGARATSKAFANNFLEFHFGWQPAVQDIHDACQTMSSADFGTRKVVGHGHQSHAAFARQQFEPNYYRTITRDGNTSSKQGCLVRISNESAYLADQMGLANPLVLAWNLLGYSFVADWFANVGDVLQAVTGFVGLEITRAYGTICQAKHWQDNTHFYWYEDGILKTGTQRTSQKDVYIRRAPGLVGPVLALKPFKGFSPMRGITACSLLLQKL